LSSHFTIQNACLKASIKSFGAELYSLLDLKRSKEILWHGDPAFWPKHSPVLFPIVGTLQNNTYNYKHQSYSLGRHGFAREMPFDCIDQHEDKLVFQLSANDETKAKYPFDFELRLTYVLVENGLNIYYSIENKGQEIMPFNVGAHPAFALPQTFEDYSIYFDNSNHIEVFRLDGDVIGDQIESIPLINGRLHLNYNLFEKNALIIKAHQSEEVHLFHKDEMVLKCNLDNFLNLGIWTMPNAPFICIEPWHGYADTIRATGNILEKEGIDFLQPNELKHFHFRIEV
jgi:galactose mutarotase-like enzyme